MEAMSTRQYKPPFLSDQWVAETELRIGERILSWLRRFPRFRLRLIRWAATGWPGVKP